MSFRFEIVGWQSSEGTTCRKCDCGDDGQGRFPIFADDETVICASCGDAFGSVEDVSDLEAYHGSL